jgi:hypothetical protein
MADFTVADHGSIVLVTPLNDECRKFLEDHTAEEAQWYGGALVVEPRYLADLVTGLNDWGFN